MRWGKHMSDSHDDEKMAALLDRGGVEGYGFYWLLWEHVAKVVEKGRQPELTYSLTQWSLRLHSHPNRVAKYLVMLGSQPGDAGVGLIVTSKLTDGRIRVSIPKILKYKDEYTKKSGEYPEKVPIDTYADTHASCASDSVSVSDSVCSSEGGPGEDSKTVEKGEFDGWFENEFWPIYPRHKCKAAAKSAGRRKMTTPERRSTALQHLRDELPELLSRPADKRPHAATWFNQDRWSDALEPDPAALVPVTQKRFKTKAEQRDELFADRLFREMNG